MPWINTKQTAAKLYSKDQHALGLIHYLPILIVNYSLEDF